MKIADEAIFKICPSAILIDASLVIRGLGPTAKTLIPSLVIGSDINKYFYTSPHIDSFNILNNANIESAITLFSKDRDLKLRGILINADDLFLLAVEPVALDKMLAQNEFHIDDFKDDRSLFEALMKIAFLRAMMDESEKHASELAVAQTEIGGLLYDLSQLSGFVSHEFNNLLSVIQLNCDRLHSAYDLPDDAAHTVHLIRQTAVRGGSVSRSLQALSGVEDILQQEPLDDFLRANWPLLARLSGPEINLTFDLDANDAWLNVPIHTVLHCLIHLVRNLSASRWGKVQVQISTKFAADSTVQDSHAVILDIQVAAEKALNLAGLLSQRSRLHFTVDEKQTTVQELITSIGGEARYNVKDDFAGNLTFQLPLADPVAKAPQASPKAREVLKVFRRWLVVVEDEPNALEALIELFEFEGFKVVGCTTAEQALESFEERPDAVLITDVVLPKMDGLDLSREVASAYPQASIIIMSGYMPNKVAHNDEWVFLPKPIDFEDLINAIHRLGK